MAGGDQCVLPHRLRRLLRPTCQLMPKEEAMKLPTIVVPLYAAAPRGRRY